MLYGTLNDLSPIESLGGHFGTAAAYLRQLDVTSLTPGHYPIDGENVFANFYDVILQEPSELSFETHSHYADIQIVTDGCEGMLVAPFSPDMVIRTPYEAERDVTFYEDPVRSETLLVTGGHYVVFLPEDAHKPSCRTENSPFAFKLVIKVKVA